MKPNRITRLLTLSLMAGAIAASSAVAQQASTTEWNADPGTPGDWEDATWTGGVPVADSLAGILNGGTVDVTVATATLEQLHLGGGSTLNVGALLTVEGTDLIDNPDPEPDIPATGFHLQAGTVNVIAGGDLRINVGGSCRLGIDATGALNLLPDGALATDREILLGSGGTLGFGSLTQSGGTLTHTGPNFKVGPNNALGQYDISDGTAVINNLRLNFGGSEATQVNTVNQTGGDITFNGETAIGWDTVGSATYNIEGGTITTANRIRIGVGNKGDATRVNTFNQTGGDVEVTGRIDIGDGAPPEVVNTYDMSGGSLSTNSQILVGYSGSSSGILKLRGFADVDLPGMFIGFEAPNTGTVTVEDEAGGFITNLEVRNGSYTQSGEFSNITVTGRLWVGTEKTVSKTATLTIVDGTLELPADNRIGTGNAGNATLNIEGGTITTTNRLRVGVAVAGSGLTPTNLVNQTGGEVFIAGRLDLGENPGPTNIYQISGGSLEATGNILVGYFSDGTGTLTVDGTAEVDAPTVVMGENGGTIVTGTKGTVNLLGGTLTTGQIKVGNGLAADQTLVLDGGTIRARTGGTVLIAGNVTTASLLAGGITFDTDGLDTSTAAVMTGPGGLTKIGAGTLQVDNIQAYSGATRVEEGTLRLTQPYLADNGDVHLATGAVLDLTYAGGAATDTIGALFIDGVPVAIGEWGPTDSGAANESDLLTGNGRLNVTSDGSVVVPPQITSITVAGGSATITMTGAPNTTYVCRSSDDLVTAFAPIATVPATVTTDGDGDATFTVDASVATRFYLVAKE